jgi:C4-dicarboxylate transporter DctQ subunit
LIEKHVLVWTILALAFAGFVQVLTRYLLNYSFTWYEELSRYTGVFIAFLGSGLGVKYGMHFSMDAISKMLARPWKNILDAASNLVCSIFFLLVAYYSWKLVAKAFGYGTTSAAVGLPMWLAYLPIPLFSMVIAFRHASLTVSEIRGLRK